MKLKEIKVTIPGNFKGDPSEQAKETKRLAEMVAEEIEGIRKNYSTFKFGNQVLDLTGIELSGKDYVEKMTLIYGDGGIKITYIKKNPKA